jgi:hypothetical protein
MHSSASRTVGFSLWTTEPRQRTQRAGHGRGSPRSSSGKDSGRGSGSVRDSNQLRGPARSRVRWILGGVGFQPAHGPPAFGETAARRAGCPPHHGKHRQGRSVESSGSGSVSVSVSGQCQGERAASSAGPGTVTVIGPGHGVGHGPGFCLSRVREPGTAERESAGLRPEGGGRMPGTRPLCSQRQTSPTRPPLRDVSCSAGHAVLVPSEHGAGRSGRRRVSRPTGAEPVKSPVALRSPACRFFFSDDWLRRARFGEPHSVAAAGGSVSFSGSKQRGARHGHGYRSRPPVPGHRSRRR